MGRVGPSENDNLVTNGDPAVGGLAKIIVRYEQGALLSRPERSHSEIPSWLAAVRAAESKKATDLKVLDLTGITSFTDYFLVCTGANQRQIQAISDEIGQKLKERGEYPISVEGYRDAEWVLVDYGDFVIHIFSPRARAYYDLERLWRNAKNVAIPAA